ncbi:MAG: rhodanese-like domain-containing protein [Thermodesulfobacteriota bacterium]
MRVRVALLALACTLAITSLSPGIRAEDKLPTMSDQSCLKCHEEYKKASNLFAGKLVDVSQKAKTIQLKIDNDNAVIYYDDATALLNAPSMKEIPKSESVRITYVKKDGKNLAKKVEVKKGIAVPKEKLATVEEVAALVAQGPEKGKYTLLDSRPPNLFAEGHIPTAKSMPYFGFDKLKDTLLPQDKEALQIYYCIGFT